MPWGARCRFCLRRDQQQLLNLVEGKNVCGAPPQTTLVTRGRGVRKPIDRLLWPLALGAWTYATGSPTPEGLGSIWCAQKAPIRLSGFRHPRTVRTRSSSIIGHTALKGNDSEPVCWEQATRGVSFCPPDGFCESLQRRRDPRGFQSWLSPRALEAAHRRLAGRKITLEIHGVRCFDFLGEGFGAGSPNSSFAIARRCETDGLR